MALAQETAERTWAAVERAKAEEALRKSEEKFRKLFDSIDEGLSITEMIYDDKDEIVDMVYRQVNKAFERQGGIQDAVDRSIFEMLPGVEAYWLDYYKQVARSGQPMRFENHQQDVDRWFNVYFWRVDTDGRYVGTVFNDITERKRRERNLAFLANLMSDFAPLGSVEEIMEMATSRIAEHFHLSHCTFLEINPEADACTILHNCHAPGLPALTGTYKLSDFHTAGENRLLASGRPMVVHNVDDGTRTAEQIAAFEAVGVRSLINTPYLSNGRWVFNLAVTRSQPGVWQQDEIELLQEVSARVWLRMERARAEAALRESEEKYRTLFEKMDEGFVLAEVRYDPEGQPADILYLEGNPAASRMTGVPDYNRRMLSEVLPGAESYWLEIYDRVSRTGVAEHLERYAKSLRRWYGFNVSRVTDEQGAPTTALQVAVVFQDITERKEAEEALRESEERLRSFNARLEQQVQERAQELYQQYQVLRQAEEVGRMGSWEYDPSTGAFHWSEGMYRLFGLPQGSPVSPQTYLAYALAEDRPVADRLVEHLRQGQGSFEETLRIQVDHQTLILKVKGLVLRDEQGGQKVLGVDVDLSELKRLEEENFKMRLSQQKRLLMAILEAQEEERRRISESLHNGVGQLLYATKINLEHAAGTALKGEGRENFQKANQLLSEAISETRRVSHELVPMLVRDFGLEEALYDFCKQFSRPGFRLRYEVEGLEERLPEHLELALYRIAQELVNNIVKHAGASEARILLRKKEQEILLQARDNGRGFAPEKLGKKGIGLRTISDRVKLLGGSLTITAPKKGTGTVLTIRVPSQE